MTEDINTFNKYHRDAKIEETPNGCIYYVKPDNALDVDYIKVLEIYNFTIIQYSHTLSFAQYKDFIKFFENYEVISLAYGYKRGS